MTYPAGDDKQAHQRVGRYEIFDRIASGGMATVHLARLSGAEGFSRVVAVKRMHPHFLVDPAFKAMFIAEARVAARVRHPNVVPILDVLAERDEIVIIMDYVHGESLMALTRAARKLDTGLPIDVATSIMVGLLQGLHAAHTALDEKGKPLGLVHRDVSPHNVLVGTDGVARVLDFGIAKVQKGHDTDPGVLKGKFSYIAPELVAGGPPSRQSDLFSASVVFWELLTGGKLFQGVNEQERLMRVVEGNYPRPRSIAARVPERLDRIVMRGLALEPTARHASALDMAIELEQAVPLATQRVVGEWVSKLAGDVLAQRSELIHQIESTTISLVRRSAPPAPTGAPGLAVPSLPSLAPSTILSATPPGVEPPPPVTSEVRATRPKTLRIGLIAAGGAVVVAALAAFFALRSPLATGTPTARAPATSTAGSDHDRPRAAAPNVAVPAAAETITAPSVAPALTVAPTPSSPVSTTTPTPPPTAASSLAEASRHPLAPRSGNATSSKSPTHGAAKRAGTYLPNEL
jgi:serine/threonine-protein kinase